MEDMIFDYFGIIEPQYEASTNSFNNDPTFKAQKTKIVDEVKEYMKNEYDVGKEEEERLTKLT